MEASTIAEIALLRHKALEGTLTQEELTRAIVLLRQDRRGAAIASERSKKAKAKAEIPSADDLLKEMEGL